MRTMITKNANPKKKTHQRILLYFSRLHSVFYLSLISPQFDVAFYSYNAAFFKKQIGALLRHSLHSLVIFHTNFFYYCCFDNRLPSHSIWFKINRIVVAMGPLCTSSFIMFLVNSILDLYPQIQSWQIAYITWGVCVTLIHFVEIALKYKQNDDDNDNDEFDHFDDENGDQNDAQNRISKYLLYPFGIKPVDAGHSFKWSVPLVSLAPSLVIGFLANFALEEKHVFQCGADIVSDTCYHDGKICCIAISSHIEPFHFITGLASTILAAWGVIKGIGYFIGLHDDGVIVECPEDELMKGIETVKRESLIISQQLQTFRLSEFRKEELMEVIEPEDESDDGEEMEEIRIQILCGSDSVQS